MKHSFLIVVFCLLFGSNSALACELKMRIWGFAPLAMKDKQNNWHGTDVQYGKAMASELGCKLKLVEAPWAKGLELLRAGKIDFMVNVSKSKPREQWLHFIGPQRMEVVIIASIAGKLELISDWQQLSKLDAILMRQKGSEFGPRFNQMLTTNKLLESKLMDLINNDIRIELLHRNRADGILVDRTYIDYYNQQTSGEKLVIHPLKISQAPVYYAFSKAHTSEEQLAKINKAYKKLYKTEAYQNIDRFKNARNKQQP